MGSITTSDHQHYGLLRFAKPDLTIPASQRALFSPPANTEVVDAQLPLHDMRTSTAITPGPAGLDDQGFTYIQHPSALSGESWFSGTNMEDIYLPEVCDLVCKVTGAKSAIVNNCAFRRKHVERQNDPSFYLKKDDLLDKELSKLPRDRPLVYGKEAGGSLEPSRITHIDYSLEGLRRTVRECRRDITDMAQNCISKEEEDNNNTTANSEPLNTSGPRYAAYSVWRPLQLVKRDPLVVCDWRSLDRSLLQHSDYRALSDINPSEEYMMDALLLNIPTAEQKDMMKWYWLPQQKEDEVLIVKFADTRAEMDPSVAAGCAHASPVLLGAEEEMEPRLSIECRVLAFWE